MFRSIQEAFNISQARGQSVDDFFTRGELKPRQDLEEFLQGRGSPKLMIYYQPDGGEEMDARDALNENRLIIARGDEIKLEGKGVFFLRTTQEGKPVNLDKIDNEVLFGEITPNTLDAPFGPGLR